MFGNGPEIFDYVRSIAIVTITTAELRGSPQKMHETMQRSKAAVGRCSEARVLLLSLDERCAGANLTAANHVMFTHRLLRHDGRSPADIEVQAVGRFRLFGQNRTVHVWHFVTHNTIEEPLELDNQLERRVYACDLWQLCLYGTLIILSSS